nr:acyl-CoA thioesterase [Kibdelosporangium sp. MJ126-NF4]CEL14215.1 TebC [Kibdelosporangium sp. MJ126-NF4]CTQ88583.1 TebC [Kibdelosporangium sp. MJ126-NF4]
MAPYYELRHLVGFEETTVVGNVYFVNYMRWQGKCRELFLLENAPDVLENFGEKLTLFTTKVECELFAELALFDEVSIRMRLEDLTQTRIEFGFDYVKLRKDGVQELVARGRQHAACVSGQGAAARPAKVPESLRKALAPYAPAPAAPTTGPRVPEVATVRNG